MTGDRGVGDDFGQTVTAQQEKVVLVNNAARVLHSQRRLRADGMRQGAGASSGVAVIAGQPAQLAVAEQVETAVAAPEKVKVLFLEYQSDDGAPDDLAAPAGDECVVDALQDAADLLHQSSAAGPVAEGP